ncbi:MAG TPA: S9 family peptidase, partial [Rhizobiales bacterium]|nr:S9 family peptidase [Hyphomicrobiales bacterium]
MTDTIKAPIAAKHPVSDIRHGIKRVDDYAWLRAGNWREVMHDPRLLDKEIRSYLEAENSYCAVKMADTETLQEELFAEMKGRIKQDDSSVPAPDGPYAYASKYVTGAQHPMLVRCNRDGTDETVILDGNVEAKGKAFFQLGGAAHSPDHAMLAWSS